MISRSLGFPVGYCTTSTAVIRPFATVMRACTGPQRVSTVLPVNVPCAVAGSVVEGPDAVVGLASDDPCGPAVVPAPAGGGEGVAVL